MWITVSHQSITIELLKENAVDVNVGVKQNGVRVVNRQQS